MQIINLIARPKPNDASFLQRIIVIRLLLFYVVFT